MFSLATTIDEIAARLPAALAAASALAAVRRVADGLPASLVNWVDLECRLASGDSRMDLSVRVDRRQRHALARHRPDSDVFARTGAWLRIGRFAAAWADAALGLHRDIASIWLEFDVAAGASVPPLPRFFLDFARHARGPANRVEVMSRALHATGGARPPARLLDTAAACLSQLPPSGELLYLGLPADDTVRMARLCVGGIDGTAATEYLQAIGWPGDGAALRHRVARCYRAGDDGRPHAAVLHFDVLDTGGVGARLGLEVPLRRRPQVRGRIVERPLLDDLVAAGLCAAGKRDALAAWPGCERLVLAHELWPSVVMRRVSHVKLVVDGDRPIEAKAYLCFAHEAGLPALAAVRPPALFVLPPIVS